MFSTIILKKKKFQSDILNINDPFQLQEPLKKRQQIFPLRPDDLLIPTWPENTRKDENLLSKTIACLILLLIIKLWFSLAGLVSEQKSKMQKTGKPDAQR